MSGSRGVIAFNNTRIYTMNIEAKVYYRQALQYAERKKPEEAIAAYSKSIEIDPSAAAYNGRSIENIHTGRYESAVADANKAIMISPRYTMPHVNRGNAYYKLKDYDRAIKSYLRAIQLDPGNPEHYYNLGQAYNKKGLFDDAIKSYDKTVELDPHHYAAWYNRACACSEKKDLNGALEGLGKAVAEGFADADRMKREPALENVRDLPAFQDLLGKMGREGKGPQ